MRSIAAAFAVLALASPAATRARAQETEHVSRTVKIEAGGTLRLKNFSGRVTITAGDRNDVAIDAVRTRHPRPARPHQARHPYRRLRRRRRRQLPRSLLVRLGARQRRRDRLRHPGAAPDQPRPLGLQQPVHVIGVEGSERVHGFSSRITLDDVVGSIDAHTFSGPVDIRAQELGGRPDDRRRHLQRRHRPARPGHGPRHGHLPVLQRPPHLGRCR